MPLDRLLGVQIEPGSLVGESVKKTPNGLMAERIVRSSLTASSIREATLVYADIKTRDAEAGLLKHVNGLLGSLRSDGVRESKTFTRLMADIFIDPLVDPGRTTSDRLFTWDNAALNDITRTNPGQLGNFFRLRGGWGGRGRQAASGGGRPSACSGLGGGVERALTWHDLVKSARYLGPSRTLPWMNTTSRLASRPLTAVTVRPSIPRRRPAWRIWAGEANTNIRRCTTG